MAYSSTCRRPPGFATWRGNWRCFRRSVRGATTWANRTACSGCLSRRRRARCSGGARGGFGSTTHCGRAASPQATASYTRRWRARSFSADAGVATGRRRMCTRSYACACARTLHARAPSPCRRRRRRALRRRRLGAGARGARGSAHSARRCGRRTPQRRGRRGRRQRELHTGHLRTNNRCAPRFESTPRFEQTSSGRQRGPGTTLLVVS